MISTASPHRLVASLNVQKLNKMLIVSIFPLKICYITANYASGSRKFFQKILKLNLHVSSTFFRDYLLTNFVELPQIFTWLLISFKPASI